MPLKFTAVDLFIALRKLKGTDDLSCLHDKQPAVGSDSSHMAVFICADAVCVVDLPEGGNLLQAILQRKDLHASGGSDIVVAVRALCDTADGIRRQAAVLVDDIDDLFVDGDCQAIVIGSDPETAFIINEQAVDVADSAIVIHPFEIPSIVTVQAGIGTDPQNTVIGFGDIVGCSAGESVVIVENRLHIIIVIKGTRLQGGGPGLSHGEQHGKKKRKSQKGGAVEQLFLGQQSFL